jgi:hypothetical protein
MILYLFDDIFFSWVTKMSRSGSVITSIWPSGSGSAIQDYGSADPNPKEIFMDPQHWIQPFLTM